VNLERFVIEELEGLNLNLVDGLGTAPDGLRNALGDRFGGYRYYGQGEDILDFDTAINGNLGDVDSILSSENRYGYYKNGANEYGLHTLGLPALDRVKVSTTWSPFASATGTAGKSLGPTYFSIPGARYGPWYIPGKVTGTGKQGEPRLSFNQTVAPPYVEYGSSTSSGSVPAGLYKFRSAAFVETERGRLVFHVSNASIDISLAAAGHITAAVPVGKEGYAGAYIYVDAFPSGSDPLGNHFAGILDGAGSISADPLVINDLSELTPSSDIFINPDHDISAFHDGRFYYANPTVLNAYVSGGMTSIWNGPGWDNSAKRENVIRDIQYENVGPDIFVHFTEVMPFSGGVNMTKALNNFRVWPSSGAGVNALMPSPAGLMVFCENEIFLFRGDPVQPQLLKFSSTIGNTPGIKPVSLAGVVFNIYGGEIYTYALGMGDIDFGSGISKISMPVYLPNDPFVKLAADPQNNLILAQTESGNIFIYDAGRQQWVEHPFSGHPELKTMLNYGGAPDAEGGLFLFDGGLVRAVKKTGGQTTADPSLTVAFNQLDFGDKRAKKLYRSVEAFTNSEYAGAASMTYKIGEMAAPASVDAESFPEGRHVFRLPPGVSGAVGDFEFEFSQMGEDDVVEPPIVFNYVPKGRRRI